MGIIWFPQMSSWSLIVFLKNGTWRVCFYVVMFYAFSCFMTFFLIWCCILRDCMSSKLWPWKPEPLLLFLDNDVFVRTRERKKNVEYNTCRSLNRTKHASLGPPVYTFFHTCFWHLVHFLSWICLPCCSWPAAQCDESRPGSSSVWCFFSFFLFKSLVRVFPMSLFGTFVLVFISVVSVWSQSCPLSTRLLGLCPYYRAGYFLDAFLHR